MTWVTTNLVVPIDVAALAVGVDDRLQSFAKVAHDFSGLPNPDATGRVVDETVPHLASLVTPQAFQTGGLSPGVHLHWALPDALARGETDGGKVRFTVTPNRWLVVRITDTCTAWVVESDHVWGPESVAPEDQNSVSRVVPVSRPTDPPPTPYAPPYRQIGRVFDYADWTGNQGGRRDYAPARLRTAVGYGTIEYAASYSHSPNVFGIWDPLQGIDTLDGLSYLVVGWYGDPEVSDPLWRLTHPPAGARRDRDALLEAIRDRFDWIWPSAGALPEAIVCSGVVQGITWRRWAKNIPTRAGTVDVAIGNSLPEAVAALVAAQAKQADLESPLLTFQLGLLETLAEAGQAAVADKMLHQARFGSRSGGTLWTLKSAEAKTPGDQTADINPDALDPRLVTALNRLNAAQAEHDAQAAELRSRRERLYADWCRFMVRLHHPLPVSDEHRFIERERVDVVTLAAHVAELARAVEDARHDVTAKLAALPSANTMRLAATEAPRYWQANEPVMLVSGPWLTPSARHGGDTTAEAVCANCAHVHAAGAPSTQPNACAVPGCSCRTFAASGKLRCRMHLPDELDVSGRPIHARDLRALDEPVGPLPPEMPWLVAEAILTDPARAEMLATDGRTLAGVEAAQARLLASWLAPSPVGRSIGAQPWIPLLLQWGVDFKPRQPVGASTGRVAYDRAFVTSSFELPEDAVDFLTPLQMPDGPSQGYSGTTVLGPRTAIDLRAQLDRYFAAHPDSPFKKALGDIGAVLRLNQTMAQALTGFNQALLMQEQTLQLPVCDPVDDVYTEFSNRDVPAAVGDANDAIPLPGLFFNPIRAGVVDRVAVTIVDAFGQRFTAAPNVIAARSLRIDDEPGRLWLPPRITQPARLQFRWPASPLCGWALFNVLDHALMIYDARGTALGSLIVRGRSRADVPLWQGAPGSRYADERLEPALAAIEAERGLDRDLRNVVVALGTSPLSYLEDLLAVMDTAMATINPGGQGQDVGLGQLIGQPLALVRASLRLELEGLPALDQSEPAFDAAIRGRPEAPRRAAGLPRVAFPVRLGDIGSHDDGLVGYFINDGSPSAYRTFFAATASATSGPGVVAARPLRVRPVAVTDPAQPIALTMLLDPRGSVHATSGILPVKEIALPASMYADALNSLRVTFLTTPLLAGEGTPAPALPREPGYVWSWLERVDSAWVRGAVPQPSTRPPLVPPVRIVEGWLQLQKDPNTP